MKHQKHFIRKQNIHLKVVIFTYKLEHFPKTKFTLSKIKSGILEAKNLKTWKFRNQDGTW